MTGHVAGASRQRNWNRSNHISTCVTNHCCLAHDQDNRGDAFDTPLQPPGISRRHLPLLPPEARRPPPPNTPTAARPAGKRWPTCPPLPPSRTEVPPEFSPGLPGRNSPLVIRDASTVALGTAGRGLGRAVSAATPPSERKFLRGLLRPGPHRLTIPCGSRRVAFLLRAWSSMEKASWMPWVSTLGIGSSSCLRRAWAMRSAIWRR